MKEFYYDKLSPTEQRAYQKIYDALLRYLPSVSFWGVEYDTCDLNRVFNYLNLDHPELYFVNFVVRRIARSAVGICIQFAYLFSKDDVNRISVLISQKAQSILSNISNQTMSDFEKEKYIYDYLTQNIVYDTASLAYDESSLEFQYAHTIAGVFLHGEAVCEGISKAFTFLCRKVGVPAILQIGEAHLSASSGLHSWNIVRIDGSYYHVDVTGDLKGASNSPIPLYSYFNVSDAEMKRDHSWESADALPCNSERYNYYSAMDLFCRNTKDLEDVLRRSLSKGEAHFAIKYHGCENDVARIFTSVFQLFSGRYRQGDISKLPGEGIYLISLH